MSPLDFLVLFGILTFKTYVQGDLLQRERELLYGLQLRASAFDHKPCFYPMKTPSGNYSYYGICNDILIWLSEHFHMKLIFIPASNTEIAKLGIEPALIQQLVNGEVDIVPYSFVPTPDFSKQIDFSIPLGIEYYNLLQQWPKEESRLTAIIRPFSFEVWIMFFFSSTTMVVFMAILTSYYKVTELKSESFINVVNFHTIYIISVITGQGNSLSQKEKFALRLAAGLWCLTVVVLVNAYSGTLTSYLTVPKLKPIVNTLNELAASTESEITSNFGMEHTLMFLRATSGPYQVFGNSLRNNPKLFVRGGNVIDGMKNVLELGSTYLTNRVVAKFLMAMDMQHHPNCRMTSSDPIPYIDYYSAGLPKGSRHNGIINHDFQYLWESGLLNYWLKKYTPNVDKCMTGNTKPRGRMTSFTLIDLSSAFAIIAFGAVLSFVAFLIEIIASFKFLK